MDEEVEVGEGKFGILGCVVSLLFLNTTSESSFASPPSSRFESFLVLVAAPEDSCSKNGGISFPDDSVFASCETLNVHENTFVFGYETDIDIK